MQNRTLVAAHVSSHTVTRVCHTQCGVASGCHRASRKDDPLAAAAARTVCSRERPRCCAVPSRAQANPAASAARYWASQSPNRHRSACRSDGCSSDTAAHSSSTAAPYTACTCSSGCAQSPSRIRCTCVSSPALRTCAAVHAVAPVRAGGRRQGPQRPRTLHLQGVPVRCWLCLAPSRAMAPSRAHTTRKVQPIAGPTGQHVSYLCEWWLCLEL